jgi:hypothetical protein
VAKRKTTGISDLLFDEVNPFGAVVGDIVTGTVERFPLDDIRPDPEQPRRLLPNDLAGAVNQGDMQPAEALHKWIQRAGAGPDSASAREVRELQRLASAIEQHGLINPITLRPAETGAAAYFIVTGERRYWAHVLLGMEGRQIQEGDRRELPHKIKAAVVPPGVSIRAHQIVENLMREDINVVEKAHGFLALRQEMSDDAYRRHQGPSAGDESSKVTLVPWKQVEDSLDISRQYRLRIVSVLDLSEEAQRLIDRHNLAEATIRPIVEKLKPYPDLQLKALNQVVVWQEAEARGEGDGRQIVPSVRALVDRLLLSQQAAAAGRSKVEGLDFNKFRQQVRGTLRVIEKMDARARQDLIRAAESKTGEAIVGDLQALRDSIDRVLAAVGGKDNKHEF